MSRNLLTKLDVDVLVQLVVQGPLEASEWEALVEAPDDFGTQLWIVNYEMAALDDELPQPAYTFTPLPIMITAVEGLKQCAYFIYQSADEEGLWERDGLGDVFARLKARLISLLAGFDTAPAGWVRTSWPPALTERTHPSMDVATRVCDGGTLAFERVRWHGRGARRS